MAGRTMDITLLDRNYKVNCPAGQESALQQAADALDERLRDTKERTSLTNVEQIAVMTALNLCHEWIQDQNDQAARTAKLEEKIQLLQATIEQAMSEQRSQRGSR
ncbi:MAG: cell division protein ZapA [Idiomarina sp.]|jgi:cell division protein ZapA|uniref:cell division protein ZapA n=1 Tax=Idiomarina sp. TaxID=1874361 RepID=UPI000C0F371F|nr:cell division protein ZapA [Idiomarina sp.]MAK72009.1 cell division protein ZapA [Idiomarinaceae bacterium]MBL4742665.1 cell division protein ZapA [Idiomarina sp.]MBT41993.1 cell division protein ZapA [Idiomarina sp.]PHQ75374.1 MAG: cell division protein ZapA [Idiomarina sp.]HAD49282.1 cell division protein ZapA [Idiomarina sp.]